MADVSVRPARPGDAAEVARIQIETWRQAYASILPAPVLDGLSVDAATEAWREAVAAPPSARHHVLVALEKEWLVGFTAIAPDDDETTAAFGPLLVEPRWGRRGHASRLLAAAVDHARGDGLARAVIWLPEADNVSRGFFTSAGWAPDGLVRGLDTGAGEIREVRLHVTLQETP